MRKILLPLLCILVIIMHAQGQEESTSMLDNVDLKAGYYGNLIFNNGLNVGAEYAWKEWTKTKEKKNGQRTITRQLLWNGSLGYSTNFRNQTDDGVHTYIGLIYRKTNAKRWQLNVELNPIGYYRSILPRTYEVDGDEVTKVLFPGRNYFAPSFAMGIGRLRKDKKSAAWYLNLSCNVRTPYNTTFLPSFTLQFGRRFNFKKK